MGGKKKFMATSLAGIALLILLIFGYPRSSTSCWRNRSTGKPRTRFSLRMKKGKPPARWSSPFASVDGGWTAAFCNL